MAQPSWRIAEDLRIGNGESEMTTFSDVRGIVLGTNGRVFVLDYRPQEIRAFDPTGRFVTLIARRGGGPGEISSANGMAQGPDGTIWVNDPANSRFTLFRPDGSFLRQHVVPITSYGYIWDGMVDRRGHVHDPFYAQDAKGTSTRRIRSYAPDGSPGDTVRYPCDQSAAKPMTWRAQRKTGSMIMTVPFTPTPQTALDPRGFAWCTNADRYHVVRVRIGSGETTAVITRTVAPVPVTAAERAAVIARADSSIGKYEGSNVDYGQIPKTKPVIQALSVDDAGRLWVRRTTADESATTFDVFDETGRFLATTVAPFRISPSRKPVIRGDVMWAVAVDEDDVQTVVRARVLH